MRCSRKRGVRGRLPLERADTIETAIEAVRPGIFLVVSRSPC